MTNIEAKNHVNDEKNQEEDDMVMQIRQTSSPDAKDEVIAKFLIWGKLILPQKKEVLLAPHEFEIQPNC